VCNAGHDADLIRECREAYIPLENAGLDVGRVVEGHRDLAKLAAIDHELLDLRREAHGARIELLDHGRVGEIAALLDGIGATPRTIARSSLVAPSMQNLRARSAFSAVWRLGRPRMDRASFSGG
jgi:hypothetical protein